MSEPAQAPQTGQMETASLWQQAPAWRSLTIAASLLTLVAVAAPVLLPQPADVARPPINAVPEKIVTPAKIQSPAAPVQHDLAISVPQHRTRMHTASLVPPAQVLPREQQAQPATSCALRQTATAPQLIGFGTVIGFEDHALSLARIQLTEAQNGGKIDPAYIDNQRVVVGNGSGQSKVFILPKGMQVQIGDRVMLQNGYRNMALPCNYVPIQIASDIGPSPANAPAGQPPAPPPTPQN